MATTILTQDTFTRANQSGFGTSSDGNTWSVTTGSVTLSIASNEGHITGATGSTVNFIKLGTTSSVNAEVLARTRVSDTNSNANGVILRQTATNTAYRARISANGSAFSIIKTITGTSTTLFTTSFTPTLNSYYWIRFRAVGSNLYARVWLDGNSEPTTWTLSGTDTSITATGTFGLVFASSSNTSTADFDNFKVTDASTTVTAQTRLLLRVQNTKTAQMRARLRVLKTLTAQVRAVLMAGTLASKTAQVRARLSVQNTKTAQTRARLNILSTKTAQIRAKLSVQNTKTAQIRTRLQVSRTRTAQIRAKLSVQNTKTAQIRTRLNVQNTKTAQVRLRLPAIRTRTAQVRLIMASIRTKTTQSRIRLRITNTRTAQVRIVLVTPSIASGGFTLFANGSGTVSFDSFRVTEYPDPSLSLAPVLPHAGTTSALWNALVPTNTTLGVDVSLDGVNWTDVSTQNGGSIPGIYSQPAPIIDGFGVDTHAQYTSLYRTGGTTGIWTYNTANSRLIATGGTNAIFVYNAISRADVDFFADLDTSDAGGLVWRYIDQNNFYYLLIADSLASSGTPNTITLYKIVANVQTQLGTTAISYVVGPTTNVFTRGTYRRFRVSMLAGIITCYVDGIQLLTYTDISPLTAGLVGLYNNGGTTGSRYYQLWITPQGDYVSGTPPLDVVTGKFVYTRLRLATTDPTVTPQVEDITTNVFNPNIQSGTTIPSITYNAAFISKNYDDLAKQSNFLWYIDANKNLYFTAGTIVPAPWILQSNPYGLTSNVDLEVNSNLEIDVANDLYRNRQTILGALGSGPFVETKTGDGSSRTFTLGYPLAAAPSIALNGMTDTSIGLKGTSGYDYYYALNDAVIVQDASRNVLQKTDLLTISYTGFYEVTVTIDNTAEQAAHALIAGGTGIVEAVEDHSGENMTQAAATTLANQLITRYATSGRTIIFDTSRNGLAVGQMLSIFLPEHGIWDGQFLINQVEITLKKGIGDTQIWWYKVTASELPKQASWAKLIASGLTLQ